MNNGAIITAAAITDDSSADPTGTATLFATSAMVSTAMPPPPARGFELPEWAEDLLGFALVVAGLTAVRVLS